jgi:hypothetical protein
VSDATDPLALIIGGCGAAIGFLAMIVNFQLNKRLSTNEEATKELRGQLEGRAGVAVLIAKLEGVTDKHEAEIGLLKAAPVVTEKMFEASQREMTYRIEAARLVTQTVVEKVDKVEKHIIRTGYSGGDSGFMSSTKIPK